MKPQENALSPSEVHSPTNIQVKIYRPSPKGPVLADASVTLNGCFAIRGIQIREGKNGPFVSMPSRQVKASTGTSVSPAPRNSSRPLTRPCWRPTGWSWTRGSASTTMRPRSRTAPKWAA